MKSSASESGLSRFNSCRRRWCFGSVAISNNDGDGQVGDWVTLYRIPFLVNIRSPAVWYEHLFTVRQRVSSKPIRYVMIRFQDRRGIGSLRYRSRAEHAEITVLWCEQKPVVYPIGISCQCMSYRLYFGHSLGGRGGAAICLPSFYGGCMNSGALFRLRVVRHVPSCIPSSACLAQLHASSLCIDCISSVFSAEGATRKLMLQRLPTIG